MLLVYLFPLLLSLVPDLCGLICLSRALQEVKPLLVIVETQPSSVLTVCCAPDHVQKKKDVTEFETNHPVGSHLD